MKSRTQVAEDVFSRDGCIPTADPWVTREYEAIVSALLISVAT